jgi:hypothetical protein
MRNLPRLASVQVLSFGYSRDMLEYPRREGCDHPRREVWMFLQGAAGRYSPLAKDSVA